MGMGVHRSLTLVVGSRLLSGEAGLGAACQYLADDPAKRCHFLDDVYLECIKDGKPLYDQSVTGGKCGCHSYDVKSIRKWSEKLKRCARTDADGVVEHGDGCVGLKACKGTGTACRVGGERGAAGLPDNEGTADWTEDAELATCVCTGKKMYSKNDNKCIPKEDQGSSGKPKPSKDSKPSGSDRIVYQPISLLLTMAAIGSFLLFCSS